MCCRISILKPRPEPKPSEWKTISKWLSVKWYRPEKRRTKGNKRPQAKSLCLCVNFISSSKYMYRLTYASHLDNDVRTVSPAHRSAGNLLYTEHCLPFRNLESVKEARDLCRTMAMQNLVILI